MKWFKKKSEEAKDPRASRCFRERVEDFWEWWTLESERILDSVDGDGGESIQPDVSDAVNQLCPGLAWVFGPAPDGVGHSFTLSPEADPHKRFLVRHWFSKAPELEGWTFYPARQPSYDFDKSSIRLGDGSGVKAESIWITPTVNPDREKIDIVVWSPSFASLDHKQSMQILYLYLDEALGEEGTEACLGAIEVADDKLDRAIPLTELPELVDETFEKNEWNRDVMGWVTYSVKEVKGDFPRGDIYVGSTQHFRLASAYGRESGPIEDPIAGSGAEFVFLQLPGAIFPEGAEVEFRSEISDAIGERLEQDDAGVDLGGAMGRNAAYIDLLLLDPERARRTIREELEKRDLLDSVQIFPFAK